MSHGDAGGARHLETLARAPRPAGSEAAANGRAYCAAELRALGFATEEQSFEYSAAPGRYGTPLGGLALLLLVVAAAWMIERARPAMSLVILGLGAQVLVGAGVWAGRHGILSMAILRRRGINLEAVRGSEAPTLWLAAHIDSKSQPVPLLMRAAGIVLLAASALVTVGVALAQWSEAIASVDVWPWLATIAAVGALPVLASVVGARSNGAVDNASGVATVLAAAAQLPRDAAVGVLITDAEELGLAGARAWCNQRGIGTVLNCDGIDDVGKLTVMYTRPRPQRLERALRAAAASEGQPIRVIPLIPGVLVDGVAFSDAGWEVVTLSRGAWSTLRRIHLPADNLRAMTGSGIDLAARVLARAATELTREGKRETWK